MSGSDPKLPFAFPESRHCRGYSITGSAYETPAFPESTHVRLLGLAAGSDHVARTYPDRNGYTRRRRDSRLRGPSVAAPSCQEGGSLSPCNG